MSIAYRGTHRMAGLPAQVNHVMWTVLTLQAMHITFIQPFCIYHTQYYQVRQSAMFIQPKATCVVLLGAQGQ